MGLFDDAGIDANDLDTGLKDGPHDAVLTEIVGRHPANNLDARGIQRYYSVFSWTTPDHDYPVKDFFEVLPEGRSFADLDDTDDSYNVYTNGRTQKQVRQTELAYFRGKYRTLKLYYISLGVPEDKVNSVEESDLLNMKAVIVTKKNRGGFAQIVTVTVPGSSGVTLPTQSAVQNQPTQTVSASAPASATTAPAGTNVNPFARS
jgi:hypothetical protein